MLDFNTLTPFFITFSWLVHHVIHKQNSRFTQRKDDLSRHHAMYHFHAITPTVLLFNKSHHKKNGQLRTIKAIKRGK